MLLILKKSQIVSAIQPKDYWDDKRHWEIKNNIDTLEFRVFENTDHATTLVQQNLVLKRGSATVESFLMLLLKRKKILMINH